MVNKKQKPDKPTIKKDEPKGDPVDPNIMNQVNDTLIKFAEGITKGIEKSNKEIVDYVKSEIGRLDNKGNAIAKQVDHKVEAPISPKNPMDTMKEILSTVEKLANSPLAEKIIGAIAPPAPPPPTSIESDPEYITYMKGRAKILDDLLQGQLNENLESLKLKNLQSRKELDSDL